MFPNRICYVHPGFSAKVTLSLAVAGLAAVPAKAQTLGTVVVTSTRAEQRSFDAPGAIESVDRQTIEDAGPQVNLSESLNRVSGLTILNRQNYAQDLQISIRGFGSRASFGSRGIRLISDGIPATPMVGPLPGTTPLFEVNGNNTHVGPDYIHRIRRALQTCVAARLSEKPA